MTSMRWSSIEADRPLQAVRSSAPAIRDFATKQTRERPIVVAGSLVALGVLPMVAFMTKKVLSRPHSMPAVEMSLPRNQEWYTGE